jgi:hypothetical protein
MSEEKKEVVVAKEVVKPKTEPALKELPAAKKPSMTDEEVWIRVFCAVIAGNVNASAGAAAVADRGLAEFKAKFK